MKSKENLKNDLLKKLFYSDTKNIRGNKLKKPVSFKYFLEILNNSIFDININNIENLKEKYQYYQKYLKDKNKWTKPFYKISNLGFYSEYNTKLEYYTSRGWNIEIARKKLKNRQYTLKNPSDEYRQNTSIRFKKYWEKNKDKIDKTKNPVYLEYWLNKGYSLKESKKLRYKKYSDSSLKFHKKRREEKGKFLTIRNKEYWLSKGLNEEDALQKIKEIQGTRRLERYIEKYGEKKGIEKYNQAIKKWQETLNNKSPEEKLRILIKKISGQTYYSKVSYYLFNNILTKLKNEYNIEFEQVYYGKNEYYIYDNIKKKIFFYDLTIKDINLIVEFNGHKFHPNKKILSDNQWKSWRSLFENKTANEKYEFDQYKKQIALNNNFSYIEVWDNETYLKNESIIIKEILKLYYEKRNNN